MVLFGGKKRKKVKKRERKVTNNFLMPYFNFRLTYMNLMYESFNVCFKNYINCWDFNEQIFLIFSHKFTLHNLLNFLHNNCTFS